MIISSHSGTYSVTSTTNSILESEKTVTVSFSRSEDKLMQEGCICEFGKTFSVFEFKFMYINTQGTVRLTARKGGGRKL